ncbi:MAG: HAD hydrolase family protein [Tannerellaceae bacterium]|jgi:3-deoxy-D-manno-octulosonate 8-phosphate phosphatase (KDO 8-P phosphatase)|nr:HAD hydrolase family protein [Tannerellaceae bacterium]
MSVINYDLTKIRGFVFDVDGVLSAEYITLHPNGEPMRTTNTKDGYAISLAVRKGFHIAIITGGYTDAVRVRYESLGVRHIYSRSSVKMDDFRAFLDATGLDLSEVVYAGDDIPDYQVMSVVGLPVAPFDAVPEIKQVARYISPRNGGQGVARDIIEQTLRAQGLWMDEDAFTCPYGGDGMAAGDVVDK